MARSRYRAPYKSKIVRLDTEPYVTGGESPTLQITGYTEPVISMTPAEAMEKGEHLELVKEAIYHYGDDRTLRGKPYVPASQRTPPKPYLDLQSLGVLGLSVDGPKLRGAGDLRGSRPYEVCLELTIRATLDVSEYADMRRDGSLVEIAKVLGDALLLRGNELVHDMLNKV
jgi:hypothetical protein